MTGLVGYASRDDSKVDASLAAAMCEVIRHRDWYGVDTYVSPDGTVAISRVNLNVINKGKQPYLARGGRVKVFLHGEIHNDQVVRADAPGVQGELEFIYRLYEKEGVNFAAHLKGSFVTVIIDEDQDAVLVANDKIASKPLFYFDDGRTIYFSPEIKSLLLVPSLTRKLNLAALADFLGTGYFTMGHTAVEDIKWLDNATVLKITKGGVIQHKYWELEYRTEEASGGEDEEKSLDHYQQRFVELLRQAFRRSLRYDGRYGILLSGGYDSRGILGFYLEEKGAQGLHTITWGQKEDIPHSDCAIARQLAQKLGADHRFYELRAEDAVAAFYNFILLGEGLTWNLWPLDVYDGIREKQGVDIVLRGDRPIGSDDPYLIHDEYTVLQQAGIRYFRDTETYPRVLKPHYYQQFDQLDQETKRYVSSKCPERDLLDRMDWLYVDVRMKYYLNPLNYVKNTAVESFRPLLDDDILEFVATMPRKFRIGLALWRKIVCETFPDLDEEFASVRNDIHWAAALRSSPELQRFVYRELVEKESALDEFIDRDGLVNELDAFFATSQASAEAGAVPRQRPMANARKRVAQRLIKMSPELFRHAHRSFYSFNRWMNRPMYLAPTQAAILRLLILKAWANVFLNYPVVRSGPGQAEDDLARVRARIPHAYGDGD
jgi:hypothetical protein